MIFNQFNKKKEKNILVSPLDWGLGHATRCIPIIKELQTLGFNIIIAASGKQQSILQTVFPSFTFIPSPQYKITYAKNKFWLPFKLLLQAPKIVLTIAKEHFWLKKVVKKYDILAIISDNRLGLYHSTVPTVYITHQLLIKTGNLFTEKIIQKIHYWFIKKYSFCWVPDFEGNNNLAGQLSHPTILLPNTHYIGCLSRFIPLKNIEKTIDLLVVISGPEPQRSIFENLVMQEIQTFDGNVLIVSGKPDEMANSAQQIFVYEHKKCTVNTTSHLDTDALNLAIQQSKMVLCRSGYTSIMDLVKLQQKAILVPTPGQTEQEYLAKHLEEKQFFFTVSQNEFRLNEAIKEAKNFRYLLPDLDMNFFKKQVNKFAQSI